MEKYKKIIENVFMDKMNIIPNNVYFTAQQTDDKRYAVTADIYINNKKYYLTADEYTPYYGIADTNIGAVEEFTKVADTLKIMQDK